MNALDTCNACDVNPMSPDSAAGYCTECEAVPVPCTTVDGTRQCVTGFDGHAGPCDFRELRANESARPDEAWLADAFTWLHIRTAGGCSESHLPDARRYLSEVGLVMIDEPYVGGHPEMPLHPYEPTGDGQCRNCIASEQERVVARAKADPNYRQMLMEDAALAARQKAELSDADRLERD